MRPISQGGAIDAQVLAIPRECESIRRVMESAVGITDALIQTYRGAVVYGWVWGGGGTGHPRRHTYWSSNAPWNPWCGWTFGFDQVCNCRRRGWSGLKASGTVTAGWKYCWRWHLGAETAGRGSIGQRSGTTYGAAVRRSDLGEHNSPMAGAGIMRPVVWGRGGGGRTAELCDLERDKSSGVQRSLSCRRQRCTTGAAGDPRPASPGTVSLTGCRRRPARLS